MLLRLREDEGGDAAADADANLSEIEKMLQEEEEQRRSSCWLDPEPVVSTKGQDGDSRHRLSSPPTVERP